MTVNRVIASRNLPSRLGRTSCSRSDRKMTCGDRNADRNIIPVVDPWLHHFIVKFPHTNTERTPSTPQPPPTTSTHNPHHLTFLHHPIPTPTTRHSPTTHHHLNPPHHHHHPRTHTLTHTHHHSVTIVHVHVRSPYGMGFVFTMRPAAGK